MFSTLARSRAHFLLLLLFPAFVCSREEALFASSVTYCQPPDTLLIQQFDIIFFPANQTVSFNISAASVNPNVNVTANLLLNVYGMNPVNFTLDLCSVLNGALCPLPTYNFVGADSIKLPDSLGVSDKIPGIAFKIPDLEGFAQLTLTEIGTGDVKACIQATLSNGWSAHQSAVEWVTASFALAAFLSAFFHSLFPESLTPFRFLDLFYLYQAIATSAFLNINYPSLYRAFTLNFAWAVGLVSPTSSSSLQSSIDAMRHHTGGGLPNSTSSSAVGFVNRKLSPYNQPEDSLTISPLSLVPRGATSAFGDFLGALSNTNIRVTEVTRPGGFSLKTNLAMQPAVQGEVQTVTAGSSNVLEAGIPIYANSIHIGTANAFTTTFIVSLIVLVVVVAVLGLGYAVALAIRRSRTRKGKETGFDYFSFVQSWCVRLGLIFLLPLLVLAFYQWTLKDSWLSILLSVITFLGLLVLLAYPPYLIFGLVRKSKDPYELYSLSPPTYLTSLGPLYAKYRPERYYVFLTLLIVPFLKAIFISFANPSGLAQVILLFVTEFAVLGLQIGLRPDRTKGGYILNTYLGVTRLVATGLLISFVERTAVKAIPRTVIGVIIAIIWAVAVVILILDLVIYHILFPLWQIL
ncbi:TRP-domain-containing protein, partial [Macrolepiota fuliginosa MF-IS2]